MTVDEALKHPTAKVVILSEVTAGVWCRAWIVDGTFTNSYKVAVENEVDSVRWNLTTLLTERASLALVDANAGSWFWDRATRLLWVRPLTGSIYDATIQAVVTFYLSNNPKILNDRPYDPRFVSGPSISQRIEPRFGDVGQIGGGQIRFNNADKYFDRFRKYQWNAGNVTLKIGVDLPNRVMAVGDYETMATWIVEAWDIESTFTLRLKEPKSKIATKIPFSFYDRTTYPNIDDSTIGRSIPIGYGSLFGIEPALIDPGLKKFQVVGHGIRGFDGVRIQKSRTETVTRSTDGSDWLSYAPPVFRYYLSGETIKTVTFNGTLLVEADDLSDVTSTASRWVVEENYIYVHPPSGQAFASGIPVIITSEVESKSWVTTNFASVDASLGRFTLGDDWSVGIPVSVDFRGKLDATGKLITNPIKVVEDLLTTVGETNLNASSFTTAGARLLAGTDESGNQVYRRQVGLYISDQEEVLDIIGKVLAAIGAYLYTDATGQYFIGVFRPEASEQMEVIADRDILDYSEEARVDENISKLVSEFNEREQDGFVELEEKEEAQYQFIANQPAPMLRKSESILTVTGDVKRYQQRTLIREGLPLVQHLITIPWRGLKWKPGQQVLLQYSERNINTPVEILETKIDLGRKTVQLVCGDIRALESSSGFWVSSSDIVPVRFSSLSGYGAGSLVWNPAWDSQIKEWASQNSGHWTDTGFADVTDADSFYTSRWV